MKLIGLIGSAGSGKDSFAEELHYHSYKQLAFADPLKQACAAMFGLPLSSFNHRTVKELEDPYWEVSPRQILQFVGTEVVRNTFKTLNPSWGNDFWIKAMKYRLYILDQESQIQGNELNVVITDVRFVNELNMIQQLGGHIIHLTRPEFDGTVGISSHASEVLAREFRSTYPESSHIHYVDNEGTLDDLKLKAHAFASVVMR